MRRALLAGCAALLLGLSPGLAAEVYKCTDAEGNVQFSDQACGAQAQRLDPQTLRGSDTFSVHQTQGERRDKIVGGYRSPVTLQETRDFATAYLGYWLAYFCLPPLLAGLAGLLHRGERGQYSGYRYLYSTLLYAASLPGVVAALSLGYTLLLGGQVAPQTEGLLFAAPLISLFATVLAVRVHADLDGLPGFDSLSGLLTQMALSFGAVLLVYHTHFGFEFMNSLLHLLLLGVVGFFLLRWSARQLLP